MEPSRKCINQEVTGQCHCPDVKQSPNCGTLVLKPKTELSFLIGQVQVEPLPPPISFQLVLNEQDPGFRVAWLLVTFKFNSGNSFLINAK